MNGKTLLLFAALLAVISLSSVAQEPGVLPKKKSPNILFDTKLPAPDTSLPINRSLDIDHLNSPEPKITKGDIESVKKNLKYQRMRSHEKINGELKSSSSTISNTNARRRDCVLSDFQLIRDINALAESNPNNLIDNYKDLFNNFHFDSASYGVVNDVAYFVADDGLHGMELWRSDGTGGGTYLVKDLETGIASSFIFNITGLNGKIYFSAITSSGSGVWVSDGTAAGTELLATVGNATNFFAAGDFVYFIADGLSTWTSIWKTDGSMEGTTQIIEIGDRGFGGEQITLPTIVNGLLYFTFLDYETLGWQIWRSDFTNANTYHVGPAFPLLDAEGNFAPFTPAQLTGYHDKLYFSADDGTGRKLWVSDGTEGGTMLAPGNNGILIGADYIGMRFPILNDAMFIPGSTNGLYRYDASIAGLVKLQDFTTDGTSAVIVPSEMQVSKNYLYFKVISQQNGLHDELWSTRGTIASTKLVYKLRSGESISHLYNGAGTFYFVKRDKYFGTELWRTITTYYGSFPILVSDVFRGSTSSYPANLTAIRGKLMFTAADEKKGNELFITSGNIFQTALVKDINTTSTSTSEAGFNPFNTSGYRGMTSLGKDLIFTARERVHGSEIYISDGTKDGTKLLHDVITGESGIFVRNFLSKNDAVYFQGEAGNSSAIYKTNGRKDGLVKITADYPNIQSFSVADNGVVFYTTYNSILARYEVRSSASGAIILCSSVYIRDYLNTVGNIAVFVAGDDAHGYELWKSNGTQAGTALVKDINPGPGNSIPAGLYLFNESLYFAAVDADGANPSFWKTNGTRSGTIKLKDIDPFYGFTVASTADFFARSKRMLYFSAVDYTNSEGTVLWKTDGTVAGTRKVKDINPTSGTPTLGPSFLTDVDGTLFFVSDDGINGRELWKSDGTTKGTKLVKDITPGAASSNMVELTSFDGRLFFRYFEGNGRTLWSSDGTEDGTNAVPGIDLLNVAAIFPTKEKLFACGYNLKYGAELYAGGSCYKKMTIAIASPAVVNADVRFDASVYPNPALSNSILSLTGDVQNVIITITDLNGKKVWQNNIFNSNVVMLPTQNLVAGMYLITATNGKEIKTLKLIKE